MVKETGVSELWPRKAAHGYGTEVLRWRGAEGLFIFRIVGPPGARAVIFASDANDAQVAAATAWTRANAKNGHFAKDRPDASFEHLQPDDVMPLVDRLIERMPRRIVACSVEGIGDFNADDEQAPPDSAIH